MTDTKLKDLFPDEHTLEDKSWKFLEVCYNNNWKYRKAGRELGIHHATVRAILEDIKNSPVYLEFVDQIGEKLASFEDRAFTKTLFDRYEEEYKRLEDNYSQAAVSSDVKGMALWTDKKHRIMKDQLRAALLCQYKEDPPELPDRIKKDKFKKLYDEAMNEYGEGTEQRSH